MSIIRTTDAGKAAAGDETINNVNDSVKTNNRISFTNAKQIKTAALMIFTNVSSLVAMRYTVRM